MGRESGWTRGLGRLLLTRLLNALPTGTRERLGVHLGKPDLRFSLRQLRRFGFEPRQVLDVGAFRGEWTEACLGIWPDASVTCVEPQQAPQEALRSLAAARAPRITVWQGLLGASENPSVPFAEVGSGSSILSATPATCVRPMWTLDSLIEGGDVLPPDFVKLDVQGYELEILAGFERHLRGCEVLQVEISLLPIVAGTPLLHEVVAYLFARGFVMFDVDEVIRAPSDAAVWQIDALFCRPDSTLRTQRRWSQRP